MVMMGTGLKWLVITAVGSGKYGNELPDSKKWRWPEATFYVEVKHLKRNYAWIVHKIWISIYKNVLDNEASYITMKTKERSVTRTWCPMQHNRVTYRMKTGAASKWKDQAFESQNGDRLYLKTSHDPSLPHSHQFPIPTHTFLPTIYKKRWYKRSRCPLLRHLKHLQNKKRSSHFTIPGARRIKQSTLRTDDRALVARAIWDLGLCTLDRNNTNINFLYHRKHYPSALKRPNC